MGGQTLPGHGGFDKQHAMPATYATLLHASLA